MILMGVDCWEQAAACLLADGWPADTPAAAIESGTLAWERRVEGKLSELGLLVRQAGLASPATFIVGEAAVPCRVLRQRPTVLFTGLDPSGFRWLGSLLHWPALQLTDDQQGHLALNAMLPKVRAGEFDWVLLADKPAVAALMASLHRRRWDVRACRALAWLRPARRQVGPGNRACCPTPSASLRQSSRRCGLTRANRYWHCMARTSSNKSSLPCRPRPRSRQSCCTGW